MEAVLHCFAIFVKFDAEPIEEEFSAAISSISNGVAPSVDGIPAKIFNEINDAIFQLMHAMLQKLW